MAKKKSANSFNMAAAIRDLLTANPKSSFSETINALVKGNPKESINKNSFQVAFYNARKKLGIGPSKKGKKTSAKKVVVRKTPAATGNILSLATLQAAAKFVSDVGDANTAIEAVRQLRSLQIQ
jgi:hypothetical protein